MKRVPHALVVGGTRGIGRAVVRRFEDDGFRVSVVGRRLPSASDRSRRRVRHWSQDVRDHAALPALVEQIVDAAGPLDRLVCSAAVPRRRRQLGGRDRDLAHGDTSAHRRRHEPVCAPGRPVDRGGELDCRSLRGQRAAAQLSRRQGRLDAAPPLLRRDVGAAGHPRERRRLRHHRQGGIAPVLS